jgi:DNA-binding MarR family transcriptional regulator
LAAEQNRVAARVGGARSASTIDPKGEFPLDLITYVFHVFAVVGKHREARLESALKPLGLNLSRHRALSVIASLEPCTMTELAEFSAVDRTTLTRTVDPLVRAGCVIRTTPPQDRRQVVLTLTDAGRELCRRSLQAIYRVNRELLSDLDEEKQRELARALEAVLARLTPDPAMRERLTLRDARALR